MKEIRIGYLINGREKELLNRLEWLATNRTDVTETEMCFNCDCECDTVTDTTVDTVFNDRVYCFEFEFNFVTSLKMNNKSPD